MKHKDPKEYAKELVEKYLRLEDDTMFYWDAYYHRRMFDEQVLDHAIKCALIDVQNTIDCNPCCEDSDRGGNLMYVNNSYYFEQVKTEINNLK